MTLKVGSVYRSQVEAAVVAEADVLVAGGGTAGCVAALAAARNGARVLLVERHGYLGGMMTGGNAGLTTFIGYPGGRERRDGKWVLGQEVKRFAYARKRLHENPAEVRIVGGIPLEVANRLIDMGAGIDSDGQAATYVTTDTEAFKALLFTMMEEAGVELLLHSWIADAITEDGAIKGVVVENKLGRQALLGGIVIDATGDGDVAARAGAPFNVGVAADDISARAGIPVGTTQNMGMMYRYGNVDVERLFEFARNHPDDWLPHWATFQELEDAYDAFRKGDMVPINLPKYRISFGTTPIPGLVQTGGCNTSASSLSPSDLTRAEIAARKTLTEELARLKKDTPGFENAYLTRVPEISVRETRLILGEQVLSYEDILESREFEDGIGRGGHPIDVSPIPEDLKAHKLDLPPNWSFSIPYRCLVPQKVENLLVAGRCISATHEAFGCIRPTAQCMVTGQAAGTAAAICVKNEATPRNLDTDQLRRLLVEQEVIL